MTLIYSDGGRKASGKYSGRASGDCVARAIANATGLEYDVAYNLVRAIKKASITSGAITSGGKQRISAKNGIPTKIVALICKLVDFETCTEVSSLSGIPTIGTYIIHHVGHLSVMIDGNVIDTFISMAPIVCYYSKSKEN